MKRLDLRTTERNTTVPDLVFGVQVNDADPVSAIASVVFRLYKNTKVAKTYQGDDFVVTAAGFTLSAHTMDLPTFPYIYNCVITFEDGTVKAWFGGFWLVTEAGKFVPAAKNYSPINQALNISGNVSEDAVTASVTDDVTITVNDGADNISITVSTGSGTSLPSGGTTGQALVKASDDDGDAEWSTIDGSGDLLASANLSDLDDAAIARQNLDVERTNIYNEVPSGAINGSNATFTTAQAFAPESIRLTLNGIKQIRGGSNDFNNTDAQTIVFSTSPQLGDQILIDYKKA